MKKKLFVLSVIMSTVVGLNTSNAQKVTATASQEYQAFGIEEETQNLSSSPINDVSETVHKKFEKQFPKVDHETWVKTRDGYVVRFAEGAVQNWIFLNKKADVVGKMRYYEENELPSNIRDQVKSTFYDYRITSIQEITIGDSTAYLVAIKANHEWKIIRVAEDGMDIYREYEEGETGE